MTTTASPHDAEQLLLVALDWLGQRYGDHVFYVERDIVFTIQTRMNAMITTQQEPGTVYNDYPMIPRHRRHLTADLALLDPNAKVSLAAEFKYEPCHRRHDVLKNKLPVTT